LKIHATMLVNQETTVSILILSPESILKSIFIFAKNEYPTTERSKVCHSEIRPPEPKKKKCDLKGIVTNR